uniref:Radical SAM core domain-containing protein n=1 Tax=Rhodosorus marinus TaxID=101924 RepID=A0A7S3AC00_9RHOD
MDLGLPLKLWDENILLKTRQADFFDVILVGDGEELLEEFISEWQKLKSLDISRTEALTRLAATVEGAYVPELYEVEYECADGPVKSVKPVSSEVPAVVKKRTFRSRTLAASTVITPISAWENIHMVEAVRSCPEMCRFCLASYSTLPFRSASIEEGLIPAIDRGLEHTRRIGILGASVTQHPQFDELVDKLSDQKYDDVRISLSSVRTNSVTEKLARMLSTHDSRSITVAVESGSERLRNVINKKLENDQIVEAARVAQIGGLFPIR